jgi:hypothetical protein
VQKKKKAIGSGKKKRGYESSNKMYQKKSPKEKAPAEIEVIPVRPEA